MAEADDPGTWMSKAELAAARGISLASAGRLIRRHSNWRRQPSNDGNTIRVLVPRSALDRPKDDLEGRPTVSPKDDLEDDLTGDRRTSAAFETAILAWQGRALAAESRIELAEARAVAADARADRFEADAREVRTRLDWAEGQAEAERSRADQAETELRLDQEWRRRGVLARLRAALRRKRQ
jgi:hypothetical protein